MDKLQQNYSYFEEANPGIIRKIGSGLKILDIGCGYGSLGEAMTVKGNQVFGIDLSPAAVRRAQNRVYFACEADLTKPETIPERIRKEKFDIIVLSDVIEHLYNPKAAVIYAKTLLRDDGKIILSVPNVANWATRLHLLFGLWEYTVSGVLDRSHIRFFTLNSVTRLLRSAGLEIIDISVTPYFIRAFAVPIRNRLFPDSRDGEPSDPAALMQSSSYNYYLKFVYPLETLIASCWTRRRRASGTE